MHFSISRNNLILTHNLTYIIKEELYKKLYTNYIRRIIIKEEFETLWIEITLENNPNVIIASIYRHPTPTNDKFLHSLEKALTKLKKEKNKLIVLTGDFNQNLLKYGDNSGTTNFLNLLTENNYEVNITGPTRMIDFSKPSLLDNIFTLNITDQISGNFLDKISYDHLPNFISFNLRNPSKKNVHIKTRDSSNFDDKKFQEDLAQLDLSEHTHLNTNDLTLTFHYHFKKVLEYWHQRYPSFLP